MFVSTGVMGVCLKKNVAIFYILRANMTFDETAMYINLSASATQKIGAPVTAISFR